MSSVGKRIQDALDRQEGGSHYKNMAIQPVEFIVANNIPYREANVIKYTCRHAAKNGVEDIKKAIHYLEMIRDEYESQPANEPAKINEKYAADADVARENIADYPAKNGWIEWNGGECPVDPLTPVEVMYRYLMPTDNSCAGYFYWQHSKKGVASTDIIAYRVIEMRDHF
jgi:hypothetical protein